MLKYRDGTLQPAKGVYCGYDCRFTALKIKGRWDVMVYGPGPGPGNRPLQYYSWAAMLRALQPIFKDVEEGGVTAEGDIV